MYELDQFVNKLELEPSLNKSILVEIKPIRLTFFIIKLSKKN